MKKTNEKEDMGEEKHLEEEHLKKKHLEEINFLQGIFGQQYSGKEYFLQEVDTICDNCKQLVDCMICEVCGITTLCQDCDEEFFICGHLNKENNLPKGCTALACFNCFVESKNVCTLCEKKKKLN